MKLHSWIPLAAIAVTTPAFGHLTYGGRDLGTFDPGNQTTSNTISVTNIASTWGWAYATDADYGDSHRSRAFKFVLINAGDVTITVAANTPGFLPGFSLYEGLAISSPHDTSTVSSAYLAGLFGGNAPGTPGGAQGAYYALGNWQMANDSGDWSYFNYIGNAADGSSSNYGSASGINGDGNADGYITRTFSLAAGSYTLMVGGAQYEANPITTPVNQAAAITLSVVPEPSAPLLFGLSSLGFVLRRRRQG